MERCPGRGSKENSRRVYYLRTQGGIGVVGSAGAAEGTDFGGTDIAELIEGSIGQGVSAGDDYLKGDGKDPWLIP